MPLQLHLPTPLRTAPVAQSDPTLILPPRLVAVVNTADILKQVEHNLSSVPPGRVNPSLLAHACSFGCAQLESSVRQLFVTATTGRRPPAELHRQLLDSLDLMVNQGPFRGYSGEQVLRLQALREFVSTRRSELLERMAASPPAR